MNYLDLEILSHTLRLTRLLVVVTLGEVPT
jgi:hypothetical protein